MMNTTDVETAPLLSNSTTLYNACDPPNNSNDAALPVDDVTAVTSSHRHRLQRFWAKRKATLCKIFGIILVMCAGFSFTSSNVMQKFSVRHLSFWQLLANRALVQLLGTGVFCIVRHCRSQQQQGSHMFLGPPNVRIRTVGQGLLGGVLLACMFIAVKYVPLGNASAIMFCTPIFTFLLAPCMLGERYGLYRLLITVLMAFGVLFITRPSAIFGPYQHTQNSTTVNQYIMPDEALPAAAAAPSLHPHDATATRHMYTGSIPLLSSEAHKHTMTPTEELVGYVTCFAVPFLSALISIITRQCNIAKVPVVILMFWFGVGATIVVIIASLSLNVMGSLFDLTSREFFILLSITGLGLFGNMCYTFAVKFVSPSLANVFRSFEVILNFVLQVQLEKMAAHDINFVGIVLLLLAVIVMSFEAKALHKWGGALRFL